MKKIGRVYLLCADSYEKIQAAKSAKEIMSEYVALAVEDAAANGLDDSCIIRPEHKQFIYMPEATFYKMQTKASKLGISTSEFVRRAVRQYGN